ncbi:MAG TPA: NFACT RNA binding domain-containing protein, partial [Planctomycetota bacterium]|nr:NFACT RNA binding domain-containing protein [Planctomycetota bacterium]
LRSRLERRRERAASLVAGLEQRAVAAAGAERVRLDGELLKLALGTLRRGLEQVTLVDVYADDATERVLALDPRRTPHENVELYFERYKKLARAEESVALELARAREKHAALAALLAALDAPDSDPAALEARALADGLLDERQQADPRKRRAPEPRKPYRVFSALRGSEVRVGRSAKDNDALTLRHSRGNDLWLHTADAPGSHVVLRLERGAEADPEEQLDAAHLAVHFSPLRDAARANVHVALRKAVHKPRGAKPGLVTLSGGRILSVRMQPERLARLLGRERHAPERPEGGA